MQFIKATDKYCSLAEHVPAPIFRKTFEVGSRVESAQLSIAVSGFYELYVNGENITSGFLAPYISNPDHVIYADSYDLAPYLHKGKNAVAVILGNGFANQDVTSWDFNTASCRGPLKLALEIQLDGESVIESDESFRVAPYRVARCRIFAERGELLAQHPEYLCTTLHSAKIVKNGYICEL